MSSEVVPVEIKGLVNTANGAAVFVGNHQKVFVIYVDGSVGSAISMFLNNVPKERPLTHDLFAMVLQGVGAKVERVVINDLKGGTYFARLILQIENELHDKRMILEFDARPSDCLALATKLKAPIFVSQAVWEEVDDMSELLKSIPQPGEPGSSEE